MENANGGSLYLYPFFLLIIDSKKNLGLIDIRDVKMMFETESFMEEEYVPKDSRITKHIWKKVNKSGGPDKRFKDNYEIPVCEYGSIILKSDTGLNEQYMFSNHSFAHTFTKHFNEYKGLLSI